MKSAKKLLSNQIGMSLIEVTVASAIAVIVSMGVVKINETGQKGMKQVSSDFDLQNYQQSVLFRNLSDQAACTSNFGVGGTTAADISSGSQSITNILNAAGATIASTTAGSSQGLKSWEILSMSMGQFMPSDGLGGSSTTGSCDISVVFNRTAKSFGAATITKTIPVFCRVDSAASGIVQTCSATTSGVSDIWTTESKNSYDFLYYQGTTETLVGIGNVDPAIDMESALQINANGPEWPIANTVTPYKSSIGIAKTANAALTFDNYALAKSSANCFNILYDTAAGSVNPLSFLQFCDFDATKHYPSVIIGSTTSVNTGPASVVAGGTGNNISSAYSFATGASNTVTGSNSQAIGTGNTVSAGQSTAIGTYNSINSAHNGSVLMGSSAGSAYPQYSKAANVFMGRFAGGFEFSTWGGGRPATSTTIPNATVYISNGGQLGVGRDIEAEPASTYPSGIKPKMHVHGTGYFERDTIASSYKIQAGVYGKINLTSSATNKHHGVYGVASTTASVHHGYHYGVYGHAAQSIADNSGRTYGVYGRAGNGTDGWNYGTYGSLDGTKNGAGIFGTLGTNEFSLNDQYAGYFNGKTHVKGELGVTGSIKVNSKDILEVMCDATEASDGTPYVWNSSTKKCRAPASAGGVVVTVLSRTGTGTSNLGSSYDYCALGESGGEDGYKDSTDRDCRVYKSGSSWYLKSRIHEGRSNRCSANCFKIP